MEGLTCDARDVRDAPRSHFLRGCTRKHELLNIVSIYLVMIKLFKINNLYTCGVARAYKHY